MKARDLAQRTFDITKREQDLGAGSSYQTLSAQRDLALAELDLVNAMSTHEKAKVELDRATGLLLDHAGIVMADAERGEVTHAPAVPYVVPRQNPASAPSPTDQTPPQQQPQ